MIWILGAPDPEMSIIEDLLRKSGQPPVYALYNGQRVTPATAYKADSYANCAPDVGAIATVECAINYFTPTKIVDHHRPGDPGYGRPPAKFLPASSVGQVLAYLAAVGRLPGALGVPCRNAAPGRVWFDGKTWLVGIGERLAAEVPPEIVLAAAADHCLAAAYAGQCPGVDPDALMVWRAESRATFQKRAVAAVLADVKSAMKVLAASPRICPRCMGNPAEQNVSGGWCEHGCIDGIVFLGAPIRECPEAAARLGIAFSVELTELDGTRKRVLQAASPAQVRAWMHGMESRGLTPYGDPERGFAGVPL